VKELFLAGLSQLTTCAVTGHLADDVPAIKQASVGFTLGKCGCDLARASGDVIILDDDFNSIYNAVQWGRNLFDNCRKFIQFQLTVNISCIWIVLLGGISLGQSPFSVLELLWINLIMDVLAAIALSSEAPLPGELRKERVNLKKDALVTPIMWRQIYSQTLYQVLVMTTLLYAAPAMFGIKYNLVTGVAASDPTAAY
jgi:magnesium-transporting ATPase (P-type)